MWNFSFTSKKDNQLNKEAEGLLQRAGFAVRDRQVKKTVVTRVDGKEAVGYVEADYLVRKEKQNYVVLAHSSLGDPEPNEPAYRRRLLELERAFAPAKVLVLDLNKGELHRVDYRFPRDWSMETLFNLLIGLFIVAAIIGIIWMLTTLRLI